MLQEHVRSSSLERNTSTDCLRKVSVPTQMLAATYCPIVASENATSTSSGSALNVGMISIPKCGDGEILLRVRAASICGTDVKIIRNGHRKLSPGQRIVLGHEFIGDIVTVGKQVQGYHLGQRVGVVPNAGCGRCPACMRGQANYCPTYTAFGIDRDGGHASYVVVPEKFIQQGNVMPIPEGVSDAEASLLEPFSCVVNGVRSVRVGIGDRVVIYGAGPIGMMHAMLCRASGASKVMMVDIQEGRLEKSLTLGCDLAINSQKEDVRERVFYETDQQGADVVITACPVPAVQTAAVHLLASYGRLCLFGGLPKQLGPTPIDTNAVHYGNFQLTGTTGGSADDYRTALRLLIGKRIQLNPIISDCCEIRSAVDLERAYKIAMDGAEGKVVLQMKADDE